MSKRSADAWIDWLYDIETSVKVTEPSSARAQKYGIKPTKYLILRDGRKFPEGVLIGLEGIGWEPKPYDGVGYELIERANVDDSEAGILYIVTLIQRAIQIYPDFETMQIPIKNDFNQLRFGHGKLEKELNKSKDLFMAKLESAGLNPDEREIYSRLVGSSSMHGKNSFSTKPFFEEY